MNHEDYKHEPGIFSNLFEEVIMKAIQYIYALALAITLVGCGSSPNPSNPKQASATSLGDEGKVSFRQSYRAVDLLTDIDNTAAPDDPTLSEEKKVKELKLPPNVTSKNIEAAMTDLETYVKPKDNKPDELEVDKVFERSLDAKQKKSLNRLVAGYNKKAKAGEITASKAADGKWKFAVREPNEGNGKPGPGIRHATGDGYWRWSYSTSWWGHTLKVNHNLLWYLCAYPSWMIDNSGLPSWAKYVLRLIVCAPHSLDSGTDGSTIYVTWLLVFWYSP